MIFQGFRQGNARDRNVAVAFSVYFLVRLTLSAGFEKLTGIGNDVAIGGWRWPIAASTQFSAGQLRCLPSSFAI